MKKVIFYVDGFNFYYGLKEMIEHSPNWRKFYWIDFVKLFKSFLKEDEELVVVNYFTSRPKNAHKQKRQEVLMQCNKALNYNTFSLIYGNYQEKTMTCKAKDGCNKKFIHLEEKQTDVNIAIQIVEDCYKSKCDKVVLVSGDSDFIPPLKLIKNIFPKIDQMVLFPPHKYSSSIGNLGIPTIGLESYKPRFNKAILDEIVQIENLGKATKTFIKPDYWK